MKFIKEYFFHLLTIGFFVTAVTYQSWLLGLCSVIVAGILSLREGYELYISAKQTSETVKSLRQMAEDQAKLEKKFEQWQTELGKVSYRMNQMGDYVGSPRD